MRRSIYYKSLQRALNIKNIDHRVNQVDFEHQHADPAFPWLGQNIEDVEKTRCHFNYRFRFA